MATDWTAGYGVSFEYWEVDKSTFKDKRRLYAVDDCEITRDISDQTLGSATMSLDEWLPEETYIRVYLITTQPAGSQNSERVCLGTFLAQTPSAKMDGKTVERPLELYTPLKELDDDYPPVGYTVRKNSNAVEAAAYVFSRGNVKVVKCTATAMMPKDITARDSDTWLAFGKAILEAIDMELTVDCYGYVSFAPKRDAAALSPTWTYVDDAVSILMPEAELTCDWHNVPNVVEVMVSNSSSLFKVQCVNDDKASPVSTESRGRVVKARFVNPESVVSEEQATLYAHSKLRELSQSEREVVYTHGYCPVKLGDGVRIVYSEHSLDCKAKVVKQVIKCCTDFEVEETATYSEVLWNG